MIEGLKEGLICSRGKSSKIIEEISPQKLLYLIFPSFFLGLSTLAPAIEVIKKVTLEKINFQVNSRNCSLIPSLFYKDLYSGAH